MEPVNSPLSGTAFSHCGAAADLALGLSRSVAAIISAPKYRHLPDQLNELASLIAQIDDIEGVIVVAFDEEGLPLTSGAYRLDLSREGSQLKALFDLHRMLLPQLKGTDWFAVGPPFLELPESTQAMALPVGNPSVPAGLILITPIPPGVVLPSTLEALKTCGMILAAAIQSSIRTVAWGRIQQLQGLARQTFQTLDFNLSDLVHQLADLFHADSVTILQEEHDELCLAASSDYNLESNKLVINQRSEGLSGYVFETGKALRLNNTQDREEILKETRVVREGPVHLEHYVGGSFLTGQFLGVPMLFGGKVVGVICMSRRGGAARFTLEDEKALLFFAGLMGAVLAPSWSLLIARSVLDSVSEAIAVSRHEKDEGGNSVPRIVMANQGAEKLLGLSQSELKGRDARDIYSPEDYERIRGGLIRAREKGRAEYGPVTSWVRRADGTPLPVVISFRTLTNYRVSPPSLYTIGLARDTSDSELKAQQHQRILELLDAIGVAHFQADQNGITREPTATESKITGYPLEELKGLPRETLYQDPYQRTYLLEKARKHKGQLTGVVQQMRRKDGTLFWAEGDLRIIKDPSGHEIGLEGFFKDVTDRIRLQRFLNEDTERVIGDDELFARLKADAEFHLNYLSSLSHQLQTPLGSLIETLRNFENGITNQRQLTERLPYVIGQVVVCTRLVRNLSYMDKILRGEPFQRETVPLSKLAIETKLDFTHLLRDRRLELVVDDDSLDRYLKVQGHREMLRQVLVNLVDNAIKYSLPETSIHVRARQWPEGPALEISNQGFSISEEDRRRIFERGFRTKKAQALIPHGTGLGLWLVRKIVEAHGASIRCHEVLEEGQKRILFRITFPHPKAGLRRH